VVSVSSDGSDWSLLEGGQLMNVVSKRCASAVAGTTALSASDCAGASTWKFLSNGQAQVGDKCLSQAGEGAGIENVATHAAVAATSSASASSHSALAAVDSDEATFWASSPGDVGPVALTIDLGEARNIDIMKIIWEFPAQSFVVSVSSDGSDWTEVFGTNTNMVRESRIPLSLVASKLRVDMKGPHPRAGSTGRPRYGIRSVVVLASRLDVSLDECTTASQSEDARDKYFPVAVSDFDPSASAAFRAELPALAAAKASLSESLGRVLALPDCAGEGALLGPSDLLIVTSSKTHGDESTDTGLDVADIKLLLATTRTIIVSARESLR